MKSRRTSRTRRRTKSHRRKNSSTSEKEQRPFFEINSTRTFKNPSTLNLSGKGHSGKAVNFGSGSGVQLKGKTTADYSNNEWTLVKENGRRGKGCKGCGKGQCAEYSAIVRSTFQVSTKVTLPEMSSFGHLTKCQKDRVRAAINNKLAPHEQEHVAAFETYNGTVDTPIKLKGCRNKLGDRVEALAKSIHIGIEGPRRAKVQAVSDALDPFVVNVNMKCP